MSCREIYNCIMELYVTITKVSAAQMRIKFHCMYCIYVYGNKVIVSYLMLSSLIWCVVAMLSYLDIPCTCSLAKSYKTHFIDGSQSNRLYYVSKVLCGWDYMVMKEKTGELHFKAFHMELLVL